MPCAPGFPAHSKPRSPCGYSEGLTFKIILDKLMLWRADFEVSSFRVGPSKKFKVLKRPPFGGRSYSAHYRRQGEMSSLDHPRDSGLSKGMPQIWAKL
jgi:hypothetical protein